MDVKLALLADFANTDAAGKMNLIGVFRVVNPVSLPVSLPNLNLALVFEAGMAEVGQSKKIQAVLMDQDGQRTFECELAATVPLPDRPGARPTFSIVIGVQNLVLEKSGDFEFAILVNEEQKTTLPLYVAPPLNVHPKD